MHSAARRAMGPAAVIRNNVAAALAIAPALGVRALALAAMLFAAVSAAEAQRGPARVTVDPVAEVEVAETQTLIARLVAVNRSVVATRVAGIVGDVHVDVGSRVAEGDPLISLDTELLTITREGAEAAFTEAEAGVEAARAGFEATQNAFERMDGLRGSAAYSRGRMDDLTSDRARAAAELARAEAAIAVARSGLRTAQYNLRNAVVDAPFSGVVVQRSANLGAYLDTGAPVATLIDDNALEVEADVPTEIIAGVDADEEVTALLDDGSIARARVRAVVPNENPATRTRPVRFTLEPVDASKPLAAGQSVALEAPVGDPRAALSVAKDALVQQAGGWIVYIAREGKAMPVEVTIGAALADRFEVRGNLSDGDLAIVRGNERLRPGQEVAFDAPSETQSEPSGEGIAQTGDRGDEGARADDEASTVAAGSATTAAANTGAQ